MLERRTDTAESGTVNPRHPIQCVSIVEDDSGLATISIRPVIDASLIRIGDWRLRGSVEQAEPIRTNLTKVLEQGVHELRDGAELVIVTDQLDQCPRAVICNGQELLWAADISHCLPDWKRILLILDRIGVVFPHHNLREEVRITQDLLDRLSTCLNATLTTLREVHAPLISCALMQLDLHRPHRLISVACMGKAVAHLRSCSTSDLNDRLASHLLHQLFALTLVADLSNRSQASIGSLLELLLEVLLRESTGLSKPHATRIPTLESRRNLIRLLELLTREDELPLLAQLLEETLLLDDSTTLKEIIPRLAVIILENSQKLLDLFVEFRLRVDNQLVVLGGERIDVTSKSLLDLTQHLSEVLASQLLALS